MAITTELREQFERLHGFPLSQAEEVVRSGVLSDTFAKAFRGDWISRPAADAYPESVALPCDSAKPMEETG